MVRAVFYDLETSDKNPIGQILNYSFIAVNEKFEQLGECSGDIRLSRLQLPSPDAILKNRVNVEKHQASVDVSEREAMARILEFLSQQADLAAGERDTNGKLLLIGYNSNRFDLPFLRTSLIRNGLNPYVQGRLIYRDVLLAVRKLAISNAEFPCQKLKDDGHAKKGGDGSKFGAEPAQKLSLTLERVTQELGLLSGIQSHHSRDDVILTIKLAEVLRSRFGLDVLRYDPFEIGGWLQGREAQGDGGERLIWSLSPNYDLSQSERAVRTPMALLEANYRYALLINLERYAKGEGRRSISWFNQAAGAFYSGGVADASHEIPAEPFGTLSLGALAKKARADFKTVTLANFFPTSSCDIEQDIYRLDMPRVGALERALWGGDTKALAALKDRDAKILYLRARLAQYRWTGGEVPVPPESSPHEADAKMASTLLQYAQHRYGGKLQLAKSFDEAESMRPEDAFHPSLEQLLAVLEARQAAATEAGQKADVELLEALRKFYFSSDIMKLSAQNLIGTDSRQRAQ